MKLNSHRGGICTALLKHSHLQIGRGKKIRLLRFITSFGNKLLQHRANYALLLSILDLALPNAFPKQRYWFYIAHRKTQTQNLGQHNPETKSKKKYFWRSF